MGDEIDGDCFGFGGALWVAFFVEFVHATVTLAVDGFAVLVDCVSRHCSEDTDCGWDK